MSDHEFTFTLTVYEFCKLLAELEFGISLLSRDGMAHDAKACEFLWKKLADQANGNPELREVKHD